MRTTDGGIATSFRPGRPSSRDARRDCAAPTAKARGARRPLSWLGASAIAALVATAGYGGAAHAASKLQVLYSFRNLRGTNPVGGLIADSAGNLYGTAEQGGRNNDGVVFELSPPVAGQTAWTETVLHSFSGADGQLPDTTLIRDGAGNLYGAAELGGAGSNGAVFELSPPVAGQTAWTETVLHSFSGPDGSVPASSLIADGAGNLYGTTIDGGAQGDGLVFELSPPAAGQTAWTQAVLHSFNGADGQNPAASLIADGAGNLYGTAAEGGAHGDGVVYELSPPAAGQTAWTETVLHSFNGSNGQAPSSPLIADGGGNLYGTTSFGGSHECSQSAACGVVFELSPPAAGQTAWTETVLRAFNGTKGYRPYAGLLFDGAGNLYGTTFEGGPNACQPLGCGVVFELSPPAAGRKIWTETALHFFNGVNGNLAFAGLIADGAGNLYGTTQLGGKHDAGVVYKLTP